MQVKSIDETGKNHLEIDEGFRTKPYQCSAGVYTKGFGTTININGTPVKATDPLVTVKEAEEMMRYHLEHRVYPLIEKLITVELDQDQFNALASFLYNMGPKGLTNKDGSPTKIRMRINTNPLDSGIINAFLMWDHADPNVLARHAREVDRYFKYTKTKEVIQKLSAIVTPLGYTVKPTLYLAHH